MEKIKMIAERIKGLREILEIPTKEMAEICNITEEEYIEYEKGNMDYTFSFLNACANRFNVELTELITGEDAHLNSYSIERKGEGLSVERRKGFDYRHLASRFKNRKIEPYLVNVPYVENEQKQEIKTSTHKGQEMDYILEGTLKVVINGKEEILNEGDMVLYDSSSPHGMIATEQKGCKFLAILVK